MTKTANRKRVVSGAVAAGISTALLTGLIATPEASARDLGQGNTYGEFGIGWDSTYTIPLASGGTVEGFCLDPFLAAPMQVPGVTYGNPEPYPIAGYAKDRMAVALYLGKIAIEQPHVLDQFKGAVGFLKNIEAQIDGFPIPDIPGVVSAQQIKDQIKGAIPPTLRNLPDVSGWDVNTVAAAASVIVHEEGSAGPEGNGRWNGGGDRYLTDQRARDAYNQMNVLVGELNNAKNIPFIGPELAKMMDVQITQRKPSNWGGVNNGSQRMVAVSDLQFPALPMLNLDFELPQIDIPTVPESPEPSTTPEPSAPNTTTTTPRERTDQPSTTTTPRTVTTTTTTTDTTTTTTTSTTTPKASTTPRPEKPEINIRTSAGTKEANVVEKGKTIVDTVVFEGLDTNKSYRLVGELVDKETGKKTGDKGEVTFKPSQAKGEQDVEIKINQPASSELVVFERLYDAETDKLVASHEDLADRAQTVGKPRYNPEIRTQATSSTGNIIQTGTTVDDTVSYSGLEPGKTYRLEARLMNKIDGTDTGAAQSITFTPDTTVGKVIVEDIAVTKPDVTEQVVFERLYDHATGELVAVHEDITDAAQTVGAPQAVVAEKVGKKKVAPEETSAAPKPEAKAAAPKPAQQAPQNAPAQAPRQIIAAVPSGGASAYGSDAFNR